MRKSNSAACLRAGVLKIRRKSSLDREQRAGRSGSRLGPHSARGRAAGSAPAGWRTWSVRALLAFAASVAVAVGLAFLDIDVSSRAEPGRVYLSSRAEADGPAPPPPPPSPNLCLRGDTESGGGALASPPPPLRLQEGFDPSASPATGTRSCTSTSSGTPATGRAGPACA